MALTKTQVSELYVAIFNRASEGEGNAYWQGLGLSSAQAADAMLATTDAQEYFGDTLNDDQAFVELIYANTLNKTPEDDAEGIAYWTGLLESGLSRGEMVAALVAAVADYADSEDPATLQAFQQFNNRVAVSNYTADNLQTVPADYATSLNFGADLTVTADSATVINAQTAVDALVEAQPEPEPEPVPGETFILTDGRDNITGTADDDTFIGDVGQNQNGAIANAFSTGDRLDGGEGRDKIVASMISDNEVDSGVDQAPRPITKNIEEVYIEALESAGEVVTLDATRMENVEQYWSDFSRSDMTFTGVNLNGANLSITKDVTFGMRDVDRGSDLKAFFESQSLIREAASNVNSSLLVRIADVSTETPTTPLANVDLNLSFNLGDETVTLEGLRSTDGTYPGLALALRNALEEAGYGDLNVSLTNSYNQVSVANNTVTLPFIAQEILVTDPAGNEFSNVNFTQSAIESVADGFLVAGNAQPVDPSSTSSLIESNLVLDNAGRGSVAGDVVIGGMSNSDRFVEKLNLIVDRDSAISNLSTAKNSATADTDLRAFQEIEVSSAGAEGNLSIGNVYNVETFDSTAFTGDALSVTGNVLDGQDALYTYNTSAANDTINLDINNGAIDKLETGVSINTGGGNDTVVLDVTGAQSFQTMEQLQNVVINTGSGDDTVRVEGNQRAEISAGAGNDFVHISSTANGHDANTGEWEIGNASGPQAFAERALYQAQLTVTFAGFESTVTVATDAAGNFVADQKIINDAIKAAIADNYVLSTLLTVEDSTADQQIIIRSIIGGENDLAINLNQPTLVASGVQATAGQVNVPTGLDLDALKQGILDTTTGITSANLSDDAGIIANVVQGNLDTDGTTGAENSFNNGFTAGGSGDATSGNNFSVVNPGAGDDVVVFHSNDAAANVLELTEAFGNVSVVNFHDVSPNDVADVSEVGSHGIDFTAFLDNRTDPSVDNGNQLSAQNVDITLNAPHSPLNGSNADNNDATARANSVNMIAFDGTVANSVAFADLTAAQLVASLNGDTNASVTGGIVDGTLNAATSTANLIGNVQKHIVMVENVQNPGEYKVFSLTSTITDGTTDGDFDAGTALELGTLDFGASINFQLVGSDSWETTLEGLLIGADGGEIVPPVEPEVINSSFADIEGVVAAAVEGDSTITFDLADAVTEANAEGTNASYDFTLSLTDGDTVIEYTLADVEVVDAASLATALANGLTSSFDFDANENFGDSNVNLAAEDITVTADGDNLVVTITGLQDATGVTGSLTVADVA